MPDVFGTPNPLGIPGTFDEIEADVVIIGSGMGGGTLAYALKDSGARVLIVEAGDFLPRELQNWSPRAVHVQGRYKNSATWFDGSANVSFVPGNYHYVGGSSKLYGATLPRFRETDFDEVEHVDGTAPAWPLSYADLERHYARSEEMYLVHGTAGEDPSEPWRSSQFPYPPVPIEPVMASFAASARKQGLHPFALPQAIDQRPGGACVLCPTCDSYACMVDAKGEADVCAVRPALASPNVQLLTNTWIERLETDESGQAIIGAIGRRGGRPLVIRGGRFVLSAGAVNSAALLLRSASSTHPKGLGNSSDQVGRNYMAHVTSFLLAVDPLHRNDDVYTKTVGLNDWYHATAEDPFPLGNVQGLGKIRGPAVKAARAWVPMPILDAVTDRTLDLFLQTEDLPLAENTITLGANDQVVVTRKITNQSEHDGLVKKMKQVTHRAGYSKVLTQQLGNEATSHQAGTARMGEDPASSVVDRYCKAHDLSNLWIVDSSPFVSSAAVNPALTIAALAFWVADAGQLTA